MNLGVSEFLTKPVNKQELFARLEAQVHARELARRMKETVDAIAVASASLTARGVSRPASSGFLSRVRIVLVRPRGAANVGAAARAMKNMGLARAVLVRPAVRGSRRRSITAVHARDVLASGARRRFVAEAVPIVILVVGTTCRGGLYRARAETPEDGGPLILERAAQGPVALVFGPEDTVSPTRICKHCQRLRRSMRARTIRR